MSEFHIVMLVLLIIAIINLFRVVKENKSNGKVFGIIINVIAIILLAVAMIIKSFQ